MYKSGESVLAVRLECQQPKHQNLASVPATITICFNINDANDADVQMFHHSSLLCTEVIIHLADGPTHCSIVLKDTLAATSPAEIAELHMHWLEEQADPPYQPFPFNYCRETALNEDWRRRCSHQLSVECEATPLLASDAASGMYVQSYFKLLDLNVRKVTEMTLERS